MNYWAGADEIEVASAIRDLERLSDTRGIITSGKAKALCWCDNRRGQLATCWIGAGLKQALVTDPGEEY